MAALGPEWQDISTAPKDGTRIDLWVRWATGPASRATDCWWVPGSGFWRQGPRALSINPRNVTHWMPLPTPPEAG